MHVTPQFGVARRALAAHVNNVTPGNKRLDGKACCTGHALLYQDGSQVTIAVTCKLGIPSK
jgi:hypothetical protein